MTQPDPPWWEATEDGQAVALAFVKVDRKGSTAEWAELSPEEVANRRSRFTATVAEVARGFDAAQPLHWQGDGVMLFFADAGEETAERVAFEAARQLLDRARVDLGIVIRLAVHAAVVSWQHDTGTLSHPELDRCGHLEHAAPANGITVSEAVALGLPRAARRELAPLGCTLRDAMHAFAYPAGAAPRAKPELWEGTEHLGLAERLRDYVRAPGFSRLAYVGLRVRKAEPPSLRLMDVFVEPTVLRREWQAGIPDGADADGDAEAWDTDDIGDAPEWGPWSASEEITRAEPVHRSLRRSRAIIVLGDPGSGKTTLLRWLAILAAEGPRSLECALGERHVLLPLPLSIGRLAEVRRTADRPLSVVEAAARYLHVEAGIDDEAALAGALQARLDAGQCLVLLDGLDEVLAEDRLGVRRWIEAFADGHRRNRFVVSSRIVGFSGLAVGGASFVTIRPFGDEEVRSFVRSFVAAYLEWEQDRPDEDAAERAAAGLLAALESRPRLRALARNPFLLSSLALVHRAEGRLPRHRVQFYNLVAQALCETWDAARRLASGADADAVAHIRFEEEGIPVLGHLAFHMHQRYPDGVGPEEDVVAWLAEALVEERGVEPALGRRSAQEFLQRAGQEVQLLLERGSRRWGFLHLTFQEFFTAAGLHAREEFEQEALGRYLFDPRWEEVLRLGVGYLAVVQARPRAARGIVMGVLDGKIGPKRTPLDETLRRHVVLAALLAAEAGDALRPEDWERLTSTFAEAATTCPWVPYDVLTDLGSTDEAPRFGAALDVLTGHLDRDVALTAEWAASRLREAGRAAPNEVSASNACGEDRQDGAADPATLEAMANLVRQLGEGSHDRRASAAKALGLLHDPEATGPLLDALRGDPSHLGRTAAAAALGRCGDSRAVGGLLGALRDEDGSVRAAAASALGKLGATPASDALRVALRDPAHGVRMAARYALSRLGDTGVVRPFLDRLGHERLDRRRGAANALWRIALHPANQSED